jgi:N-acetylmuramoyl-L-alanine amidase
MPSPAGSPDGAIPTASARTGNPTAASGSTAASLPLRGRTIVLDPGHNGADAHSKEAARIIDAPTIRKICDHTGTSTNGGYSEAAFNWDMAQRTAKILRARGAKVILTRKNNTGVGPCFTERAAIGNRAKADAALSIHADGAPAKDSGFHVIKPKNVKINASIIAPSARLGTFVRDAVRSGTGMHYADYLGTNGFTQRSDLGGLNLSTVPKVFIECGNMRNARDAARFTSPTFRGTLARALADGLTRFVVAEHRK